MQFSFIYLNFLLEKTHINLILTNTAWCRLASIYYFIIIIIKMTRCFQFKGFDFCHLSERHLSWIRDTTCFTSILPEWWSLSAQFSLFSSHQKLYQFGLAWVKRVTRQRYEHCPCLLFSTIYIYMFIL